MSLFLSITSGIPQGSVVDQLFFTHYVNDLPKHIPAPLKRNLFADDANLSWKICLTRDYVLLQLTFLNVWQWFNSWH